MRLRALADEAGQALVVVAASMTVLLGSLALVVDWGYALSVRRSLQNAADAAALGVGKTLVTSTVIDTTDQLHFLAPDGVLWDQAVDLAQANQGLARNAVITLEYGDATPTWTASAGTGSLTEVPGDTIYVRVTAEVTFDTFIAAIIGSDDLRAVASARVRLAGASTPSVPLIPVGRHFHAGVFRTPCVSGCDSPADYSPVMLWDGTTANDLRLMALDFSRYSHAEWQANGQNIAQLISDWDRSGSPAAGTSVKTDRAVGCPGQTWNTIGHERPRGENERCDVNNWFYYLFQGQVSLTADHTAAPAPQEAPEIYTAESRVVCSLTDAQFRATFGFLVEPRAACDRGNWVETVEGKQDDAVTVQTGINRNMTRALKDRIQADGKQTPLSATYGRALTALVVLWDCGETTQGQQQGSKWRFMGPPRRGTAPTRPTRASPWRTAST